MDLLRPKLTQSLRLVAVSAAILMFATLLSEAGLGFKSFSSRKQSELDRKGNEAIASLISSMGESDLKRIILLKNFVSPMTSDNRKEQQTTVPEHLLVIYAALVVQQELGIFYPGQKSIEQEDFEQVFLDKIVTPCQQFHSKLGDWWKESSKRQYAQNEQFEWLVAENICRVILESTQTDEFVLQLHKRFEYSLSHNLVRLCNPSRKVAAKVDSIMQTVQPVDAARLDLLQSCIRWKSPMTRQRVLNHAEREIEPIKPIEVGGIVPGLAYFLRIETGHPESARDKAVIEQLIERELFEPCESIHAQLSGMKVGHDRFWARVERVCSSFAKLAEFGESNKLLDQVYTEYVRQLEAEQSDPEHKVEENMQLMYKFV